MTAWGWVLEGALVLLGILLVWLVWANRDLW
jgi:hypothetical protein